eukprot:GHVU01219678.1.p1 GENE.GHVU01219678.1~~GHVU01219678.1.p1  ORF type:complete len:202 (+),score=47.46 GHVU01219678.1:1582-2187(+)
MDGLPPDPRCSPPAGDYITKCQITLNNLMQELSASLWNAAEGAAPVDEARNRVPDRDVYRFLTVPEDPQPPRAPDADGSGGGPGGPGGRVIDDVQSQGFAQYLSESADTLSLLVDTVSDLLEELPDATHSDTWYEGELARLMRERAEAHTVLRRRIAVAEACMGKVLTEMRSALADAVDNGLDDQEEGEEDGDANGDKIDR